MGTPSVAFDVPGLRDSVVHGRTDILLEENTEDTMARWCIRLVIDEKLRRRLSEEALAWSRNFSWGRTAREFMDILLRHANLEASGRGVHLPRGAKLVRHEGEARYVNELRNNNRTPKNDRSEKEGDR